MNNVNALNFKGSQVSIKNNSQVRSRHWANTLFSSCFTIGNINALVLVEKFQYSD